eukprot:Skav226457  [mRNA]  locus=scaffold1781:50873:59437:+ [translate_table: standard]
MGFGGCVEGIKAHLQIRASLLVVLGTAEAAMDKKEKECKKQKELADIRRAEQKQEIEKAAGMDIFDFHAFEAGRSDVHTPLVGHALPCQAKVRQLQRTELQRCAALRLQGWLRPGVVDTNLSTSTKAKAKAEAIYKMKLVGFLATHQLQQLFVAPRRVAAASLLLGMQWTPPAAADEIDDEVAEYIKMMRTTYEREISTCEAVVAQGLRKGCASELENMGRLDSCSPLILVFTETVDKLKVVAGLTDAGYTVLSLTVVHFCECQEADLRDLHPLILGEADPLNLPSHIAKASEKGKGDLYLGDADAAATWLVLEKLKITAVVNASQGPDHFPGLLEYFSVDLADSPEEDLLSCVDEVVLFIEKALANGQNVRREQPDAPAHMDPKVKRLMREIAVSEGMRQEVVMNPEFVADIKRKHKAVMSFTQVKKHRSTCLR